MLHYYHGSMRTARAHLWRSLRLQPTLQALRYAAGSLLGDRVMQALRASGLARRLGAPLRMMSKKNRYAAP